MGPPLPAVGKREIKPPALEVCRAGQGTITYIPDWVHKLLYQQGSRLSSLLDARRSRPSRTLSQPTSIPTISPPESRAPASCFCRCAWAFKDWTQNGPWTGFYPASSRFNMTYQRNTLQRPSPHSPLTLTSPSFFLHSPSDTCAPPRQRVFQQKMLPSWSSGLRPHLQRVQVHSPSRHLDPITCATRGRATHGLLHKGLLEESDEDPVSIACAFHSPTVPQSHSPTVSRSSSSFLIRVPLYHPICALSVDRCSSPHAYIIVVGGSPTDSASPSDFFSDLSFLPYIGPLSTEPPGG
ncbi:hypothetical protein OF83DRAFT_798542 [Amylostereum chailletii]|nr:hypothetical protein OF83DRAFT_798542 [Amylostereum chailletii]